jgi:hypothetical protein
MKPPFRYALAAGTLASIVAMGTGATCTPTQTVADVTIGLQAAICVLNTVVADEQGGHSEAAAIEDAVLKCGVSAAQAAGVLAAYRKAEMAEGFVPKPTP